MGARQDGGRRQDPSTKQRHAGETLRAKDYNVLKTRNREHTGCVRNLSSLVWLEQKENEGEETDRGQTTLLGPWEITEALAVEERKPRPPFWKGCSARRLEKDAEATERRDNACSIK